jgi:hypothetical protein
VCECIAIIAIPNFGGYSQIVAVVSCVKMVQTRRSALKSESNGSPVAAAVSSPKSRKSPRRTASNADKTYVLTLMENITYFIVT